MRHLVTGAQDQDRWVILIIAITTLIFLICWYALSHNIHTVISHLLYIPVIFACWKFPKPGLIFTIGVVCGYIGLEMFFDEFGSLSPDVFIRCLIIVFIGVVVSYLSWNLHTREDSYRRLLSAIDTGVMVADREGTIVYANPYATRMLDRKGSPIIHTSLQEYAKDTEELMTFLSGCRGEGASEISGELLLKRNDGYPVPALVTGYYQEDENLILTLTDLSEEKWMVHELATGRMVMSTLIDAIPEGVFLSDTRGNIIEANKSCREILLLQEEMEISGQPAGVFNSDASGKIREAIMASVHEKSPATFPLSATVEGDIHHYEVSLTPVPDDRDTITKVAVVIHDITSRENYVKEIRQREEYLRMVLDGLPLATMVIDSNHQVISVNQALAMLFEQEVQSFIGTTDHGSLLYPAGERPMLSDIMLEEDVDVQLEQWYDGLSSPSPTVPGAHEVIDFFPHIGDAGKWIMSTSARLVDEKGITIGAIETFEDFSSQKAAEDAIRISEERFKIASQIATDLIFEYDQESDRILWFGDIEKWLGLDSPGRVNSLTGWATLIHDEDIGRIKGSFLHHVLTGDPITEELRIKHRNGQYQTWIIKAVALYNANFRQIKTVGIVSDVSEMRANEEAKKQALLAIEKYMEQFAVLNDHIRNPLQIIAGYNDLQGGEYRQKIADQITNLNRIIDELDKGWVESESIRDFLRRHYGISRKEI